VVYFELESRTWRQHFSYKRRKKKKQLFRYEVPERGSSVQESGVVSARSGSLFKH